MEKDEPAFMGERENPSRISIRISLHLYRKKIKQVTINCIDGKGWRGTPLRDYPASIS